MRRALQLMVPLAAVLIGQLTGAAAGAPAIDRVECALSASTGTTVVRVHPRDLAQGLPHELADDLGPLFLPGSVLVQRRGDALALFAGDRDDRAPLRCDGGPVTMENTDLIRVQTTKTAIAPTVLLDLRFGAFEPGATAETDGSSELELQLREASGFVSVRGTRESDSMLSSVSDSDSRLSLNGSDPATDPALTAPGPTSFALDGGGSDDRITAATHIRRASSVLYGGQGSDALVGGLSFDLIGGGPGRDTIDAGAGRDYVFSAERAKDSIDCGPGQDTAFVHEVRRIRGCERVRRIPHLPSGSIEDLLGTVFDPSIEAADRRFPARAMRQLLQRSR